MRLPKYMTISSEDLAAEISRVANQLGIPPQYLKRDEFRANSPDAYAKSIQHLGGWTKVMTAFYPQPLNTKEILKLDDIRNNQRAINRRLGSREIFVESLEDTIKRFPPIKVKPYVPKKSSRKTKRALSVVISDVHIGSDLTVEETGNAYGIIEEARTMAHITRTVIGYKEKYRDETELHVFLNGDIIQNKLHGPSSSDLLHMQICRAIWLLTHMTIRFSESFKKVVIHCASGNHGRDIAVSPKQAISQKFNSHETTIYYAVKVACRNLPNVKWDIPKTPWTDAIILGHRMRSTHGDTHLNIGNPGKSLNIGLIEHMTNRINASLVDKNEFKVFIVGHVHTPLVTRLTNKSFLVVNGAGQPPDEFANSLNIVESSQIQVMFETTAEHAVGDFRFIDMQGTAADSSLDKIVPPWPGLNAA